jgi:hypothetical protein
VTAIKHPLLIEGCRQAKPRKFRAHSCARRALRIQEKGGIEYILNHLDGGILKHRADHPQKRNSISSTLVRMPGSSIRSLIWLWCRSLDRASPYRIRLAMCARRRSFCSAILSTRTRACVWDSSPRSSRCRSTSHSRKSRTGASTEAISCSQSFQAASAPSNSTPRGAGRSR